MELKNAVAVCLIALFSATLVLLIARWVDGQAASRLEPQLTSILEELRAIRQGGGVAPAAGSVAKSERAEDGLIVYYFHSNTRCPTCQAIESQAHEAVQANFGPQLGRGEVLWKILNYEQPATAPLAAKFEIQMPVVVLAKMRGGQVQSWKRLDEVWGLVGDKPAFGTYVRDEIKNMLQPKTDPLPAAKKDPPKAAAVPMAPLDLPIPVPHLNQPAAK